MFKKAIVLLAYVAASFQAKADEGMWTIYNLPPQVYEIMQNEGFSMTYNDLYYGENALKNAVVNFSGYCSGVVVSPNGLVFTNHHCGFEAIRSLSTVEHDYMLNGFYAKSYEEELPNKDMFVSFMVDQADITDRLIAKGLDKMNSMQREILIDSLERALTDSVQWASSVVRPTTGCGPAKPAISPSSASMPTPRPTVRQHTARTTCPTTPSAGHKCRCRVIRTATSP